MRSNPTLTLVLLLVVASGCDRDGLPGSDPRMLDGGGGSHDGAPADSNCPMINCRPAETPTGPDATGCFQCVTAKSCDEGRADIKSNCHFDELYIGALSCGKNPSCVLGCMVKLLAICDNVGCGFCEACDCAGGGPFESCVFDCLR
jgi:hypothetical protein